MMQIYIYIPLEDYLSQWFMQEQSGENPVRLTRGSIESTLLEQILQKPPKDYFAEMGGEGKLAIVIPCFRYKSPETFFYLPTMANEAVDAFISWKDGRLA